MRKEAKSRYSVIFHKGGNVRKEAKSRYNVIFHKEGNVGREKNRNTEIHEKEGVENKAKSCYNEKQDLFESND